MSHGDSSAPAATEGQTVSGGGTGCRTTVSALESRVRSLWCASGETPSAVLGPDILTCFREKRKRSEHGAAYL